MTREHKLALIVGFSLVLVVGVLISDHFSKARMVRVGEASAAEPITAPGPSLAMKPVAPELPMGPEAAPDQPIPLVSADIPVPPAAPPAVIEMGSRPELAADAPRGGGPMGLSGLNSQTDVKPLALRPEALHGPGAPKVTPLVAPALPMTKGKLVRHEVVKGDTVSKIADRYYGDKGLWSQLQAYNAGRVGPDAALKLGVTLMVPPRDVLMGQAVLPADAKLVPPGPTSTPAPSPAVTAIAKQPVKDIGKPAEKVEKLAMATEKAKKPTPGVYTVQAGDTLSKIAERQLGSKSRWEQIRELNEGTIEDDDTLSVGQKLKLPAR